MQLINLSSFKYNENSFLLFRGWQVNLGRSMHKLGWFLSNWTLFRAELSFSNYNIVLLTCLEVKLKMFWAVICRISCLLKYLMRLSKLLMRPTNLRVINWSTQIRCSFFFITIVLFFNLLILCRLCVLSTCWQPWNSQQCRTLLFNILLGSNLRRVLIFHCIFLCSCLFIKFLFSI